MPTLSHPARDPLASLTEQARQHGWLFRCDPTLSFDAPLLSALTELWRRKSSNGRPPARSAFDMRALKPFMRNIAILEQTSDPDGRHYRVKLLGTALSDLFGEYTGRTLDDFVAPSLLGARNACYDATIAYGKPLRFIDYYRIPSLDFVKGELFAAPLAAEAASGPMVLVATYLSLKDAAATPAI